MNCVDDLKRAVFEHSQHFMENSNRQLKNETESTQLQPNSRLPAAELNGSGNMLMNPFRVLFLICLKIKSTYS